MAACEEYLNTYYGKINLNIESETVLGSADACIDRLGSLFARGIETVILRLVKPDLAQLDVLAAKILPLL